MGVGTIRVATELLLRLFLCREDGELTRCVEAQVPDGNRVLDVILLQGRLELLVEHELIEDGTELRPVLETVYVSEHDSLAEIHAAIFGRRKP